MHGYRAGEGRLRENCVDIDMRVHIMIDQSGCTANGRGVVKTEGFRGFESCIVNGHGGSSSSWEYVNWYRWCVSG